eukprot:scaffold245_cov341-Pavlova_lutheri.AAC.2
MFLPILLEEPLVVLWPLAIQVGADGQDTWKLASKLSPEESGRHLFLWQVFFARDGSVGNAWCDGRDEVLQLCVSLPRLILLWDGAGRFYPVVKETVYKELESSCKDREGL